MERCTYRDMVTVNLLTLRKIGSLIQNFTLVVTPLKINYVATFAWPLRGGGLTAREASTDLLAHDLCFPVLHCC